jgi:hypothetical protein
MLLFFVLTKSTNFPVFENKYVEVHVFRRGLFVLIRTQWFC